ncbi:MAG: hypothetical protein FD180_2975 [Planctomycetota bacterium]|nr:MAG: hypothetical protein FD180_2975 [Planctomycetota bacterium]
MSHIRLQTGTAARTPFAAVLLSAAAVIIPIAAAAGLELDRAAVASGQLWRLVTCHWTHYSFDHFLWSWLPFVLLGVLCERDSRPRFLAAVGAAVFIIPVAVHFFTPGIEIYRGLSGLDSALFSLLCATVIREKAVEKKWAWVVVTSAALAGFAAKMLFEATTSRGFFLDTAASGMIPVPAAHLCGFLVGLVSGIWPKRKDAEACDTRPAEAHRAEVAPA